MRMMLLFLQALGHRLQSLYSPSPALCPPAPQVPGPAGGLQGAGLPAAPLHQLAGEEEQGVQCAREGCRPHLTLDP